jgi:hypothetical protein
MDDLVKDSSKSTLNLAPLLERVLFENGPQK